MKNGNTARQVQELAEILDNGKSFFRTPRDIIRFLESNGTIEYAKEIIKLKDHEGKTVFNEFDLSIYKEEKGTISYARELCSFKDSLGQTVFSDGELVRRFYYATCQTKKDFKKKEEIAEDITHRIIARSIRKAKAYITLKDNNGNTVFRDGQDIVSFIREKGSIIKAKKYIQITWEDGRTYFNGRDIALLQQHKVPVQYAECLAKKGLNAQTIMYYYNVKVEPQENAQATDFQNNGKPKALIIYPTDDPVQIVFQVFSEKDTFKFFKKIIGRYDTKIRAVSTVHEMYAELDSTPQLNLLILGGHGSKTTLTFGDSKPKYEINIDEKQAALSVEHSDLGEHLDCLSKDAVIFLDSCLNGEGREQALNLANYFASKAPGRRVIAGTDVFSADKIKVNCLFPLDLRILLCHTYKDCTYTAKE